jgi:hypothetical protein
MNLVLGEIVRPVATLIAFGMLSMPAQGQEMGNLAGKVVDTTGFGVPAIVALTSGSPVGFRLESRCDLSGMFHFDHLEPGSYRIEIAHPGFQTRSLGPVQVPGDQRFVLPVTVLQVAMENFICGGIDLKKPILRQREAGSTGLEGRLADAQDGKPLGKGLVTLRNTTGRHKTTHAKTDALGGFKFEDIAQGHYSLIASYDGYASFVIESLEIKRGKIATIQQELPMSKCPDGSVCHATRAFQSRAEICL